MKKDSSQYPLHCAFFQELISRGCLVCQRVDGDNKVVLGYYFCLECGQLLDKVLKADKEPVCFKVEDSLPKLINYYSFQNIIK